MRKILLAILALTISFGAANFCHAQGEMKTVVTVSFSGYDKLLADIGVIGQLGGNPDLGKGLEMMLKLMTQGKGLAGLDAKRPWGAVALTDGQQDFPMIGFIPVSDLKQLMEVGKANPQLAQAIKSNGDTYEIQVGGPTLYVAQKGSWALISNKSENLTKAPADLSAALGDLPGRYGLAVRGSIKNLPKEFREQLLAQARAGAEVGMLQMPGEGEEEHAARLNAAKQLVQQLTTLINELDEVLLGWTIDAKTNSTYLDVELTAQDGTKLAEQFTQIKSGPTEFAGLRIPAAAMNAESVGTLSDAQVAQAQNNLTLLRTTAKKELKKLGLPEDELKIYTQVVGDVIDVIQKTVESKKTDGRVTLLLDPAAVTVMAGGTIVDGAKLENAFQQLVGVVKKDKELAKSIKLGDETYQGIHLHTVSMPTPEPELSPFVGDTLEAVVGIANDRVLVAAGRDAAKILKTAIDQSKTASDKEAPPLQITLAAAPIAKFVAAVCPDPQTKGTAMMVAGALEKADGKDHVTVTATPIAKGVHVRLLVEEGLLKVLSSLGAMAAPMMGGGTPGTGK